MALKGRNGQPIVESSNPAPAEEESPVVVHEEEVRQPVVAEPPKPTKPVEVIAPILETPDPSAPQQTAPGPVQQPPQ